MGPDAIAEMAEALLPDGVAADGDAQVGDAPMPSAPSEGSHGHVGATLGNPMAPLAPQGGQAASSSGDAPPEEAGGSELDRGGQGEVEGNDDGEDEAPEGPEQAEDGSDITDPSTMHYMYRSGRLVCRVNPSMKISIAVKCYLHSKCTLLITNRHMPPMDQIKRWLASAELPVPGEPKAAADAKAKRHLDNLRKLRDDFRNAES